MERATHVGELTIGETSLNVAVTETGKRIITLSSVFTAFGRTKRGLQRDGSRAEGMPAFLNAKNLMPYVNSDLQKALELIDYQDINGNSVKGYEAQILPLICQVYMDARADGALDSRQEPHARAAEILLVSLSKVGILALVDEATGYQYDREKDELQKILKQYIAEELLPWQKRFPDIFYKELFRLNGWDFTVKGIKKRPGVVGKWTNKLIYEQLPKGILDELKQRTPKTTSGDYSARFHQSLTTDVGHPHLDQQISQVVTLFQLSDNMQHMWQQFAKLKNRQAGQLSLDLDFDEQGHTKA